VTDSPTPEDRSGVLPSSSLFPEETFTISQLGRQIQQLVQSEFWSVWVVGEIQRINRKGAHLYFELAEKGHGDHVDAKIEAVLWNRDRLRVERALAQAGVELTEGQTLRCRGQVDFYAPFGKIQLTIRDIDPNYALGVLERRRRETLAWLEKENLLDANRTLEIPSVPLRIGLVTSHGSAAYHDFLSSLVASGFAFEVVFAGASVQGKRAERSLVRALRALFRHHRDQDPLDLLVITRGGGSRTDLAVFDSRQIAAAIAKFPVPVLTGIGHDTDLSIVDQVAHSHFKTPTGVAEFLTNRVLEAQADFEMLRERLGNSARHLLQHHQRQLAALPGAADLVSQRLVHAQRNAQKLAQSVAVLARSQLRQESARVSAVARRIPAPVARRLERAEQARKLAGERLRNASRRLLERAELELHPLERLCHQLSPQRILERGFSLTLDRDGRTIRDPRSIDTGAHITTRLAGGSIESVVEQTFPDNDSETQDKP
jgi:exodeoxyribonuclease VII large subunit